MGRGNTLDCVSPVSFWSRRSKASWAGLYAIGLGALALFLLCGLTYIQLRVQSLRPPGSFPFAGLALLLIVGLFCEKFTVRIGGHLELSASFLTFFLSSALVGPLGGFIAGVVSQMSLARRSEGSRSLFYSSMFGIVAGCTALLYWSALEWLGSSSALVVAAVGLGSGIFFQALNYLLVMPVSWLRGGMGPATVWSEGVQPFLPFHFFFLAISLGLVYIYRIYALQGAGTSQVYSTLLVMLCILPVLGLVYAFRAYAHQIELARSNGALADHNKRLALRNERLALQAVASQVTALDLKDNYTARHSAAVSQWSTDIATQMQLTDQEVNLTQLASLLHDVGKIGVPDDVLNCPGKLDRVAWAMVETHAQNGYRILSSIDQFKELANVVLYHHEKFDGSGYPNGAAGDEIPFISRIICVADSYSAMVSDRPYRKRLSTDIAKGELRDKRGIQFDPQVVDCFLGILEQHDERYQQGEAADFLVEFQKVKFLRDLPPEPEEGQDAA
jgi:HD-GYP domain-containing protein (c-di-GMP phosphodiesterase class II)